LIDVVSTTGAAPAAPRLGRSFNLFRRVDAPELRCAVPQDRAVPRFITADGWEFAGTLSDGESSPTGFDARAAGPLSGWNGFYIFESWRR
jgi:hypothetical protein